jgi:hypothetical protein
VLCAHQGYLFEEAGGGEEDDAVEVVGAAQAAAHDGVDQQGRAAQRVRHRAQTVGLWHSHVVLHCVHSPAAPPHLPAHTQNYSSVLFITVLQRSLPVDAPAQHADIPYSFRCPRRML